jgi:hypothetical protein
VSVEDVARLAAERLRVLGWQQGTYGDKCGGGMCIAGAIGSVVGHRPEWPRGVIGGQVMDRIGRLLLEDHVDADIVEWNDAPGRTVDEVIALLERVAAGEGAS